MHLKGSIKNGSFHADSMVSPGLSTIERGTLAPASSANGEMSLEFAHLGTVRIDIVTWQDRFQLQPLRRQGTFPGAHFRGQHLSRHRIPMKNLLRIGDADASDGRLIKFGLELQIRKDSGIPIVIETYARIACEQ